MTPPRTILITGAAGQLGWELQRTAPDNVEITACDSSELDITDAQRVQDLVASLQPDWILNAAAYTAVDRAEEEVERAYLVNEKGPAVLAQAVAGMGTKLLHVSTDFIFNGRGCSPYRPEDVADPIGVYGKSKWAGEKALTSLLPVEQCAIVRTAWVYSSHGGNFVKTMLRLMAEKEEIGVIADQVGTPTSAKGLAEAIWQIIAKDVTGLYHWTDAGVASWYDFAVAIQEEALLLGLLQRPIVIHPLRTDQYPTPAARPSYSVLDKSSLLEKIDGTPVHWRAQLRTMLKEGIHE